MMIAFNYISKALYSEDLSNSRQFNRLGNPFDKQSLYEKFYFSRFHHSPKSFHQIPPLTSQMAMLATLTTNPTPHQAPIETYPAP
jgi:hypothetical protein